MTITTTAVFTIGDLKSDIKSVPYRLYYEVTVFNRLNNKTTRIKVPVSFYNNIPQFIEECLYASDPIDNYCRTFSVPKTVELLQARDFYKTQAKAIKEIGLDLDAIWSELIFPEVRHEQE